MINGWSKVVGISGVVIAGVAVALCNTGVKDWRGYPQLQDKVVHAHDRAEECCDKADQNSDDIIEIKGDVKTTKEAAVESRKDIKGINANLYKLMGALDVEPAVEPNDD